MTTPTCKILMTDVVELQNEISARIVADVL